VRLLFAGTPEAAVPSLRALIDSPRHEVAAVLTRPDARAGRGRSVTRSPVGQLADQAGLPVFSPRRPSDPDFVDHLIGLGVDCAPVVAYGALLRPPVLLIPRLGWINLHFSLLPAWRGAAPVQHAVLHGDEISGASVFQLEAGLDTGPVFGTVVEGIRPRDTAGDLLGRLAIEGAELLVRVLDAIEVGAVDAVPQINDGISLAPKLTVDDARVEFTHPAIAVDRRIRACTPAPGAWSFWRGERVKLGPVRIAAEPDRQLAPGAVRVDSGAVLVGTATRPVALGWIQPAGRTPMAALDWARGARPGDDEKLG
jgi:methionyl-tRNA formyltransferase